MPVASFAMRDLIRAVSIVGSGVCRRPRHWRLLVSAAEFARGGPGPALECSRETPGIRVAEASGNLVQRPVGFGQQAPGAFAADGAQQLRVAAIFISKSSLQRTPADTQALSDVRDGRRRLAQLAAYNRSNHLQPHGFQSFFLDAASAPVSVQVAGPPPFNAGRIILDD